MYEKYINLKNYPDSGNHGILERMITNKNIQLFLDDFDINWKENASDILRIKSQLYH